MLNLGVRSMEWTKSNTCPFDTFSNLKKTYQQPTKAATLGTCWMQRARSAPNANTSGPQAASNTVCDWFCNAPQTHQWQFGTKIVINRNRQTKIFKWTPTLLNFSICLFIIVMILRFISNTHFQHDPDHKNAKKCPFSHDFLSKHCPHCWFCPISFRRNQMFFNSIRKGASRFRSYLRSDEQPYITFQMHAATESTRQRDRTLFFLQGFWSSRVVWVQARSALDQFTHHKTT